MRFNRKKFTRLLLIVLAVILVAWAVLTLWVEAKGPAKSQVYGADSLAKKALVLYDPDPIYNLDEQVCLAFGEELARQGWEARVKTVAALGDHEPAYDLYVLCANTYNWSPDRALKRFVKQHTALSGKPVVAITLGSGSTARSKRVFEKIILRRTNQLIDSRTFWLLRPNDESRMKERNVSVAVSMVRQWVQDLGDQLPSGTTSSADTVKEKQN